ncbi:MAG: DegT/DnrJ/EryC1/StrS family aminotransferase [Chloroflexi bacterium]|nr:DegT/DnrJ/EryC1/StrS family aminotransferase [Chloroflexota bacterium]
MAKLAINGGPKAAEGFGLPEWPLFDDEYREIVLDVLSSRHWGRLHPDSRVEEFERAYAEYHGARFGIGVSNGTTALELALLATGIKAGDEVLVPAVSFIASASAIVTGVGAVPIFVDIDPETACISPDAIEKAVTDRTRGVVAVHYGGYPADFDRILPIVHEHDLVLVEDCAHAQGSEWKGRKVGTFGDIGCFSFQESKALTAGEGGIVLTDDEELAESARLYHNIGRVVGRPGYQHHVLASNYRMTEFQGALLSTQLERYRQNQFDSKYENYQFLVKELQLLGGIEPQKHDERITGRGFYFIVLRYHSDQFDGVHRDRFMEALNAEGVPCAAGYAVPLYKQPAFKREGVERLLAESARPWPDYETMFLPASERFCAEEQITIRHQALLTGHQGMQQIIDAVAKIKENIAELAATE